MKKTRLALLAALVLSIAVVVTGFYVNQKRNQVLAPAKPAPLPVELNSLANNWSWSHSVKDRPVVEVRARDFRQVKDSSRLELEEVELKIFRASGNTYDSVRCKRAEFDQPAERLSSEGEVTIVLGLRADGAPSPGERPVRIRTSGLAYDKKTGICSTDRPTHFQFAEGEGRSLGAVYDPARRYLWMKDQVEVTNDSGLRLRAGELHYYESEQRIELKPWSSIERGNQGVRAATSVIFLEQGDLQRVEALKGQGWNKNPGQEVSFGGDWLEVKFTPQQTVAAASGVGGAELVSRASSGFTRVTGGRVDLEFVTPAEAVESQLSAAVAAGQARLESVPSSTPSGPPSESRILTADMIKLTMRAGGQDIQSVETVSPGRLELTPNQIGRAHV